MIVYPHVKPGDQLLVDGLTNEQEVVSRRTSRGKTFDLGGGKFRLRSGIMPVHFHDGKRWQDVDLTVTERNGLVVCDTAGYEVRFDPVVPSAVLEGDQGEAEIVLDKIGGKSKVAAPIYRVEGNEIVYDYGDYSIHAEVRPGAVEFYKLLKTPAAPRRFEWVVKNEKRRMKFSRKSAGRDAKRQNLQMVTSSDGARYVEEWTGKVGKIADKKTRRKAWANAEEYPILIDTRVDVGISADADDVNEVEVSTPVINTMTGTGKLYLTWVTAPQHIGLRFQALGIPAGATIVGAIVVVNLTGAVIAGTLAKVYADKVGDAPAWGTASPPHAITKTSGKFTFPASAPAGPYLIPMTNAMQSIVDLTSWTSGNDARFAILQKGTNYSAFAQLQFEDYPNSGYAILDVFYTTGGGISMPRVRVGH
jgi:hypothetical protein